MRTFSIEHRHSPIQDAAPPSLRALSCNPHPSQEKLGFIEDDISKILMDLQALRLRISSVSSSGIFEMQPDGIPPSFFCPITHDVMKDPYIVAETGHSYERSSIASWLSLNSTDPKTNRVLSNKSLVPNHTLRGAIDDFFSELSKEKTGTVGLYRPAQKAHYVVRVWTHDQRSSRLTSTDAHVALDLPTAELVRYVQP